MPTPRATCLLLTAVLTCATLPQAQAVTVHTWVDAEGQRHYADTPPPDAPDSHRALTLAGTATAAQDDYSIVKQWERLRAERAADAAQALERERLRVAARQAAAQSPQAVPQPVPRGWAYPLPLYPPLPPTWHGGHPPPVVDARSRNVFVPLPTPVWPRERVSRR